MARARIALARGDFIAAVAHARAALSDRTSAPAAGVLLAEALTGAETLCGSGLRTRGRPRRAAGGRRVEELEFARGDLFARTDRVVEAEQAFRAEIATYPGQGRAYESLAVLLWVSGNRSGARAILEQHYARGTRLALDQLAAKTIDALGDHATAPHGARKKKSPGAKQRVRRASTAPSSRRHNRVAFNPFDTPVRASTTSRHEFREPTNKGRLIRRAHVSLCGGLRF